MNGQLTEVQSDVKEMKEVVQSLTLIDTKLNQLLTGSPSLPQQYCGWVFTYELRSWWKNS